MAEKGLLNPLLGASLAFANEFEIGAYIGRHSSSNQSSAPMKSSLRSTIALVLAVLTGTFVTVRGYLDAHATPEIGTRTTISTPGLLLTTFPMPAYLRPAPRPAPVPQPDNVTGPDDNCPTCAALPVRPSTDVA